MADRRSDPAVSDFVGEPTRRLEDWHLLFERDLRFPIRSDRGLVGRALVLVKRLLRPLVTVPQNDLWERQRVFNLILLERLQEMEADFRSRLEHLEAFRREGLDEVMRHGDALYSRVDQRLDRHQREVRELLAQLRAALASSETAALREAVEASEYVRFEHRYRGAEGEIYRRVEPYVVALGGCAPVLDLGCGRGEALEALRDAGIGGLGVDSNAEMVRQCRLKGLEAHRADLLEYLAERDPGSLGGVVSFHVVEHLDWDVLRRVFELARRALRPGGILLFETPDPQSLVVGARDFWTDATHVRPLHPDALAALCRACGYEDVEIRRCHPFPEAARLPELELPSEPEDAELAQVVDQVNRLRDRLDDLLFGDRDYALVARRPEAAPG